ncbi:GNAT family N-acetyltransferase [Natronolimnobius sp. AArcel1]|uniref:GNAT family N-acetyltransferase n=1 Tax=Natronolimnobius sp. AArcel1 TaxID=1679093 RepID=UPI0013ECF1F6|nr:GNAT family N-acetyltransferase [Natronolimnobius sp. AArcel1]NGM68126.1 GNAT family N-acetyltransferase [Natronolimnobius sp. AArcel1]
MDWTVRHAIAEDAPAVREIARDSWHAAYDEFLGAEQVEEFTDEWYALGELKDSIAAASERDTASFLLARSGESAVGFAHAGPDPNHDSSAHLIRLYARPRVWGDGVGTALLSRLEDELDARYERLRLVVLADNDVGISFYEATGFDRVEARRSDLDGIDGGTLEEYVYEKSL